MLEADEESPAAYTNTGLDGFKKKETDMKL